MTCTIEIVCVGNEILKGRILNTNARWLARYVTSLGGRVRRISIVEDDFEEISSTILESLARKPSFIITTGGLGPTFDDKTLKAIARALARPVEINEEALDMVKDKYHQYEAVISKKIELTPARLKMANLPRDAKPLPNPVGTAPGVLLEYDSTKIIALPGVPKEMETIFEESLVPMIKQCIGNLFFYEKILRIKEIIESEIAPLIDKTINDNPQVYVKSRPKASEPMPIIEMHLTTTSKLEEEAISSVEKATKQIKQLILECGGKIEWL